MVWLSALNTWSDVLLVIAPVLFIIYYTWVSKWWKNTVGRAIMALMVATALIPLSKVIVLLADISTKSDFYVTLEVVTHALAILAIGWCIVALWRVRKWRRQLNGQD